jgi:hypothetical protein
MCCDWWQVILLAGRSEMAFLLGEGITVPVSGKFPHSDRRAPICRVGFGRKLI